MGERLQFVNIGGESAHRALNDLQLSVVELEPVATVNFKVEIPRTAAVSGPRRPDTWDVPLYLSDLLGEAEGERDAIDELKTVLPLG